MGFAYSGRAAHTRFKQIKNAHLAHKSKTLDALVWRPAINCNLLTHAQVYETWKDSSVMTRQTCMINLAHLLRKNQTEIAKSIVKEQGKTLVDAEGDVLRGIQVPCCAKALHHVARGMPLFDALCCAVRNMRSRP